MPKNPAAPAPKKKGAVKAGLDAFGIDRLCESLIEGMSLGRIATEAGASLASLLAWIDADPDRSARVREARTATAKLWDERAERVIEDAADDFALKKAKELSHHYRWRAAKVAPKEYGERQAVEHSGEVGVTVVVRRFTGE
jgi:hypothetical protein